MQRGKNSAHKRESRQGREPLSPMGRSAAATRGKLPSISNVTSGGGGRKIRKKKGNGRKTSLLKVHEDLASKRAPSLWGEGEGATIGFGMLFIIRRFSWKKIL